MYEAASLDNQEPVMSTLAFLAFAATATAATATTTPPVAPAMDKKTRHAEVSYDMAHPAEEVWQVIAADYGRIAESHPRIVKSEYLHGSLKGELGVERTCWFNEKGTQVLHEQIVGWDAEGMTFQNRILEATGFPMDPDNSLATYSVEDLGNGTSRVSIVMDFRTTPAFMGGMMEGSFTKLLSEYFMAVDHHLSTGEAVTKENFKEIARLYR
jgi:Polyketide cyclase / dehydrase and lipid transport